MFTRGFKSWCENVAIQQRREVDLKAIDPLDPWRLAMHIGIEVWKPQDIPGIDPACLKTLLRTDPSSWSAVTLCVGETDLIILNSSHSKARQASDLTHELAHLLIGHSASRMDVSEDGFLILNTFDRQQEDEANWLAGCLLLPREAVVVIRKRGTDLAAAARSYGVSMEMLTYRINVTGVDFQVSRARNFATKRR